jgi:5'-nucleotidase / UDP-sugar diphosphatase
MKNAAFYFLVIIILASTQNYSQTDNLTILYFGDTHSTLAPLGPRNSDLSGTQGGIARAASIIGMYENSGTNVLTLHSGDLSVGDFFYNKYFGVPELQILNSLGVDAMTVGNHEFDLTPSTLYSALSAAFGSPSTGFPLLSANADLTGFPTLGEYILPYTIKEFGDLKVGIFGLTTHAANMESQPYPVVINENFIETAGYMVQVLASQGCDFIILLSHYGNMADQAIATYIPGINLIVSGHDHYLIEPYQVNDTWIVQAESFYRYIGKIDFSISASSITMTGNQMIHLNEDVPEYPAVKATVDYLIADIESVFGPVYSQQIAHSVSFMEEFAGDVKKPGSHSTATGNFAADALLWKTEADFAVVSNGGIAHPIYQGPLVPADLFRAVGYGFNTDNYLGFRVATFTISGFQLYTALEIILTFIDSEDYLLQFSNLNLKYIPNAPEGERVSSVTIDKKPLNPFAVYNVAANEFILMILTAFGIDYSNVNIMTGYSEFQNLTDYALHLGGKITPVRDARIIAIKNSGNVKKETEELTLQPEEYSLEQNYPNPFNPSTVIEFAVPSDSRVRISVYNIIGEETAVLVDEFRSTGIYKVTWDAGNRPAGVYICMLRSENITLSRKMVLLK